MYLERVRFDVDAGFVAADDVRDDMTKAVLQAIAAIHSEFARIRRISSANLARNKRLFLLRIGQ